MPYRAGYPTTRPDTQGVCGDSDNGFSLLWNWNNLGPGTHTVRALLDGQEFANTTVRVTTFGEQVLRGVSGTFPLSDFPHAGDTTRVQWAESLQNFVITDGSAPGGGGHASVAGVNARLENPSLGSAQSGIAAISGWACEAQEIVIELNGVPYRAGYPTTRPDTQDRCGDTDNGFSLLWNWNNLGTGDAHGPGAAGRSGVCQHDRAGNDLWGAGLTGGEWHVSPGGLSPCRRHDPDTLGRVVAELCDYSLTTCAKPRSFLRASSPQE